MPIGSHVDKWLFPLCDPTTEDNPYGNDGCAIGPFWIMPAAEIVIAANASSRREIY